MAKENRKKRSYTKELKESVLKRLEPPINDTITNLSKELNIPRTTIYQWVKKKEKDLSNPKPKNKWTSQDKFYAVLETSTFSEKELGGYCRRKGIYIEDIESWKKQCIKANNVILEDFKIIKEDLKEEKEKNKRLERELQRKEKALAETAALLVLRKKAKAIWGDPEED